MMTCTNEAYPGDLKRFFYMIGWHVDSRQSIPAAKVTDKPRARERDRQITRFIHRPAFAHANFAKKTFRCK